MSPRLTERLRKLEKANPEPAPPRLVHIVPFDEEGRLCSPPPKVGPDDMIIRVVPHGLDLSTCESLTP